LSIKKEETPDSDTEKKLASSPNIVDMLNQGTNGTLDSETMIKETQKRVWGSLKKGFQYPSMLEESKNFLQICWTNHAYPS